MIYDYKFHGNFYCIFIDGKINKYIHAYRKRFPLFPERTIVRDFHHILRPILCAFLYAS